MKKIFFIFLLILLILTGCNNCDEQTFEISSNIYEELGAHEYKVISVYQYFKATKTNFFGEVLDQELRYCFTYIGDDGKLHEFNDFEHTEYGLWKVCVGDENKYVVKEGFDTYRWLYLTEDTLSNMQINQ